MDKDKIKEHNRKYRMTEKYKETQKRYRKTKKFKESRKRYSKTQNYKENWQKWTLKTKYGISLDSYRILLESQNGKCAICDNPPGKKSLAVDHNHKTGKVRGLLCYKCNVSLGYLSESTEILNKMIGYINKYND